MAVLGEYTGANALCFCPFDLSPSPEEEEEEERDARIHKAQGDVRNPERNGYEYEYIVFIGLAQYDTPAPILLYP